MAKSTFIARANISDGHAATDLSTSAWPISTSGDFGFVARGLSLNASVMNQVNSNKVVTIRKIIVYPPKGDYGTVENVMVPQLIKVTGMTADRTLTATPHDSAYPLPSGIRIGTDIKRNVAEHGDLLRTLIVNLRRQTWDVYPTLMSPTPMNEQGGAGFSSSRWMRMSISDPVKLREGQGLRLVTSANLTLAYVAEIVVVFKVDGKTYTSSLSTPKWYDYDVWGIMNDTGSGKIVEIQSIGFMIPGSRGVSSAFQAPRHGLYTIRSSSSHGGFLVPQIPFNSASGVTTTGVEVKTNASASMVVGRGAEANDYDNFDAYGRPPIDQPFRVTTATAIQVIGSSMSASAVMPRYKVLYDERSGPLKLYPGHGLGILKIGEAGEDNCNVNHEVEITYEIEDLSAPSSGGEHSYVY